jgi:hypothetical protein
MAGSSVGRVTGLKAAKRKSAALFQESNTSIWARSLVTLLTEVFRKAGDIFKSSVNFTRTTEQHDMSQYLGRGTSSNFMLLQTLVVLIQKPQSQKFSGVCMCVCDATSRRWILHSSRSFVLRNGVLKLPACMKRNQILRWKPTLISRSMKPPQTKWAS